MGGEKMLLASRYGQMLGSPPRGRGKVAFSSSDSAFSGITPAWAGKSPVHHLLSAGHRDHPRVGGEKLRYMARRRPVWGSPPRGRGKDAAFVSAHTYDRITPAWAGKRVLFCNPAIASKDHPRVGGEKCQWAPITSRRLGSPPRGRGKVSSKVEETIWRRITPAWAGKSRQLLPQDRSYGDHPRVGGEKQHIAVGVHRVLGSPPRGRGKVSWHGRTGRSPGITPAWAGKSDMARPVQGGS